MLNMEPTKGLYDGHSVMTQATMTADVQVGELTDWIRKMHAVCSIIHEENGCVSPVEWNTLHNLLNEVPE